MATKNLIPFRGGMVIEGWPEKLRKAQSRKKIGKYHRVPCDEERCHDCAATFGEMHVLTCDMERCPKCGNQLLSCGCFE
jgi:hypothetical protein